METKRYYDSVEIPKESLERYERIFFLRNLFQKPDLFSAELQKEEDKLKELLPVLDVQEQPIETYDAESLSMGDIKKMYEEDIRPIVLKGYAKNNDCVKLWSPEFFKKNYGDFDIFFTSTDKIFNEDGSKLGTYIDSVIEGTNSRRYIENMSDIFNTFPELHDHLGLDRLNDFLGDYATYHRIAQLFIGGPGTGAVYHCANELNCFLNIYGEKKWTFTHPKYSVAMGTTIMNKGYFVGSVVKHKSPKGYIEAHTPLYNRIPKLSVVLQPGDMLLNPPWWWHAVDNISPVSIAVATRWQIEQDYIRQQGNYELVQSLRTDRLSRFRNELNSDEVVIPDTRLRRNYVSYEEMGWKSK